MVRALLHVLIMLAMLWVERRSVSRLRPARAAVLWYALGVPLMAIEAAVSGAWKFTLLQNAVTALFFLPPAYAAFWLAKRRNGILLPFVVYLAFSCVMGLVVGLTLAHTPFAFGNP